MKNYKYEASMKDTIQSLIHKMFDATTLGNEEDYSSYLRQLAFELDEDDDYIDGLISSVAIDSFLEVYDQLAAIVNRLYYEYLEAN